MDWGRAKTILIIAFIITNIFLAYNVYNVRYYGYSSERINDAKIEEVKEILKQKGISINTPIPRDMYSKEILTVEYSRIDTMRLAEAVYKGQKVQLTIQGDFARHSQDGTVLEIKNDREIFYKNLGLEEETCGPLTEQEAAVMVEDFLKELELYKPTMTVGGIVPTEKGYLLTILQKYEDTLIEVSLVEAEVSPKGIHSMHMLWLEPVKAEKNRKKIYHAIDALIKVTGQKEVQQMTPVEINGIKLIHYFDWKDAKEGETFPAWRISIGDRIFYVNALSGQMIE